LQSSTTQQIQHVYISNCIRSTKFDYEHNAYAPTHITINSVHPDKPRFLTNTNFYKTNFTKSTTSNILKNVMYILM